MRKNRDKLGELQKHKQHDIEDNYAGEVVETTEKGFWVLKGFVLGFKFDTI